MEETKHEEMNGKTLLTQEKNNDNFRRKKYNILRNILLISLVFLLNFTAYMVCFFFFPFDLATKILQEQPYYLNQENETISRFRSNSIE